MSIPVKPARLVNSLLAPRIPGQTLWDICPSSESIDALIPFAVLSAKAKLVTLLRVEFTLTIRIARSTTSPTISPGVMFVEPTRLNGARYGKITKSRISPSIFGRLFLPRSFAQMRYDDHMKQSAAAIQNGDFLTAVVGMAWPKATRTNDAIPLIKLTVSLNWALRYSRKYIIAKGYHRLHSNREGLRGRNCKINNPEHGSSSHLTKAATSARSSR